MYRNNAGRYGLTVVSVPGRFRSDVTHLDLETVKVPAEPGFTMKTGEPLGRRWSAFLAGVSSFRRITIVEKVRSEEAFLRGVRDAVESGEVVYCATRKFDEMILRGRFTYARRGPEDVPFYPAMPGASGLSWRCLRSADYERLRPLRGEDVPSKDVSSVYAINPGAVMVHLLRDVATLILMDGEPDAECEAWLRRVLSDWMFADSSLFADV